jgi:APA family basic amino acid/polyamine antiporter
VFSIENVALITFRRTDLDSYQPSFKAPGYPYVQLFGIAGCFVLLTQMGLLPILGAFGIILGGVAVYLVYGREKTDRLGAVSSVRTAVNADDVAAPSGKSD